MKILLLEDEYMLLSQIKSYLIYKNHTVVGVEDGKEALSIAQNEKFDLFLLDINTPNATGLQVLESIRSSNIQTPIVMITADTDIGTIDKAFRLGCNEYLKKPFALRELEIRIDRVMPKPSETKNTIIKIAQNYEYDTKTDNLLYKGEVESLTHKQLLFIKLLATNLGRIIDYEKCKEYIWGENVSDITLRSLVNRTRNTLKEPLVTNNRGIGYMIKRVEQ